MFLIYFRCKRGVMMRENTFCRILNNLLLYKTLLKSNNIFLKLKKTFYNFSERYIMFGIGSINDIKFGGVPFITPNCLYSIHNFSL